MSRSERREVRPLDLLVKDILAQAVFIPRALLLTGLFVAFYLYIKKAEPEGKWQYKDIWKNWRPVLFLFYASLLLISTVFSRQNTNPYQSVFEDFGFRDNVQWNNEIIENILLFIPLTLLFLNAFSPEKPWKASLIVSVCATGFIEVSQLLFWLGEFQLADIFHNIIGGMVGCGVWRAGKMITAHKKTSSRGGQ